MRSFICESCLRKSGQREWCCDNLMMKERTFMFLQHVYDMKQAPPMRRIDHFIDFQ